ncbi:MAG: peptidoglycan DD-metalloendopeptidase family protein [Solobacterium sp.]|nr:peptidoglycan DD-metalloendopeptidase family protein [Solobacterium sp.]
MKRLFRILCSLGLLCSLSYSGVYAEEGDNTTSGTPDYSDTEYWTSICTGSGELTSQTKSQCMAFMQASSNQSTVLSQKIKDIESQREAIANDILYYAGLVQQYQADAAALNGEIADINGQIAVSEKKIEELELKIEENRNEIEEAEEKIKHRMVIQQRTMRLNQYLDILMGARSFDEFIRIANGLSDITNYDTQVMQELSALIDELNHNIEEVEQEKEDLQKRKDEVVAKQNEYLALMYQAQVVEQEYQQKSAELEAEGNRIAGEIEQIQKLMEEITEKLNEVVATAGWTYPVPSIRINAYAGTWHYASGGVHLGADFSGPAGSKIVAVGNGVILHSADGCTSGGLGNGCGANIGGSWGGGNQAYLLTKINGGLYAVKYLHMSPGTVVEKGTIVAAGQQIGLVGSTGNSSGPHCHIEVFYLGDAGDFTNYARNWNGDLAFGCGWGSAGLSRLCENGVGAPCRVKPESLFGG